MEPSIGRCSSSRRPSCWPGAAALGEDVSVTYGDLTGCLRTRDYTPLDLMTNEYKWYCPGVGQVAEVNIWNGSRVELVSATP